MSEPYIPAVVQAQADAADQALRDMDSQRQTAESTQSALELPAVSTPALQPPPASPPQPSEDFEHKYRVLQGKYNAEVPRLNAANRDLQQQNNDLAARLTALEQKLSEAQQPPQIPQDFSKIQAEYGDDLTHVLKDQAATISQLKSVISQLQQGQTQVVKSTQEAAVDGFWRELRRIAPDWERLNSDQYFLAWLGEADGLSGLTRYDSMQYAFKRLDADAVARFFQTFQGSQSPSASQQLQQQIAPPASGTGNANVVDSKPVFTQAQVSNFFKEVSLGKWNHRREEAAAMERAMELAQIEGRIR